MSGWQLLAVSLSWSLVIAAGLAWDFGRRWLQEQKEQRVSNDTLNDIVSKQMLYEDVQKKLAQDWLKKFGQLENDWKQLEQRANAQFAGAVAQAEQGQFRGYHRG